MTATYKPGDKGGTQISGTASKPNNQVWKRKESGIYCWKIIEDQAAKIQDWITSSQDPPR